MPLDLDIMLHLLPVFFLTTDFYLLEEKYVQKDVRFYAPGMTIVFTVWYSGWIEYLAVFNHRCESNSFPRVQRSHHLQ